MSPLLVRKTLRLGRMQRRWGESSELGVNETIVRAYQLGYSGVRVMRVKGGSKRGVTIKKAGGAIKGSK
jgi:hypothetical protein